MRDQAQLNEFARSTAAVEYKKSKIEVQLEEKKEEGKTEEAKPVASLAEEDEDQLNNLMSELSISCKGLDLNTI